MLRCLVEREAAPLVRLTKVVRSDDDDGDDDDDDSRDGSIVLEMTEARPGQSYVAISHVWSHGLGNAAGNSLPTCRAKRIMDIVAQHSVDAHDLF
jgi:hypothetical protein